MKNDFYKVYGAEAAQNGIIVLSETHCVIFYGYGTDDLGGWNWRKDYDHIPTVAEVRADIEALVNAQTDERILGGMKWRGMNVWLAQENQMNIKAAYDLAFQTNGATLPIRFKIGEDNGEPEYFDFEDLETFGDFYMSCIDYIQRCIMEGWNAKDEVDYSLYQIQ